jgi:uncharacterized protein YodC (DUF2158 family)
MSFKKGDLVVLKSGGPKMTVDDPESGGRVHCVWFAGAKRETGYFDPDTIQLASQEQPKTK